MHNEIRSKAAAAVVALANRAASAGRKPAEQAQGPQWVASPDLPATKINPEKLRAAVVYYEIAESIDAAAAGWGYPRALLLEEIGAFDEAAAAFSALAGTPYEFPGTDGIQRIRQRKAGMFDALAALGPDAYGNDADDATSDEEAETALENKLAAAEAVLQQRRKARSSTIGDEDAMRADAAATAQRFVNHMLDRDWKAARAMLAKRDAAAITENDLRECFECLFEGEDYPETANVFDVKVGDDWLEVDDLAWVYVSIDSENQEAVAMIVTQDGGQLRIRSVEFGRP